MDRAFFLKNVIYALVFYALAIAVADYDVDFSVTELSFVLILGLVSSLLFPFSLFFLTKMVNRAVNDINWVNWGFSLCVFLSIPPIGFIFLIYYIIKSRPRR